MPLMELQNQDGAGHGRVEELQGKNQRKRISGELSREEQGVQQISLRRNVTSMTE